MRCAQSDARRGRGVREPHVFREPTPMACALCLAGPFAFHGQRSEHEHGRRHLASYRRYQELYNEEIDWIEREEDERMARRSAQLETQRQTDAGRSYLERKRLVDGYTSGPWYKSVGHLGDLKDVKSRFFDFIVEHDQLLVSSRIDAIVISHASHMNLVVADLLLLAFVRVQLIARFGSIDGYREHCIVHSELNPLAHLNHWKRCLTVAAEPWYELLQIIMPWIICALDDGVGVSR